jgi:hypothetical protein
MKRCLSVLVSALFPGAFALLAALPAHAQIAHLPHLGSPVPPSLLTVEKHEKQCRTAKSHYDPCVEIDIQKIRYTVAWDAQTKNVTYLFTDDRHLVTDTGLAVGNVCRVVADSGHPDSTVSYLKWVIDPRWKDQASKLGQTSVWFAALQKDNFDTTYDNIVGFVQSRYLQLKP